AQERGRERVGQGRATNSHPRRDESKRGSDDSFRLTSYSRSVREIRGQSHSIFILPTTLSAYSNEWGYPINQQRCEPYVVTSCATRSWMVNNMCAAKVLHTVFSPVG